jgi:hypothetical protein
MHANKRLDQLPNVFSIDLYREKVEVKRRVSDAIYKQLTADQN